MSKTVKPAVAEAAATPTLPQAGGSYVLENGVLHREEPEPEPAVETSSDTPLKTPL